MKLAAGTVPNVTALASVKPVPVTVTVLPPAPGPDPGDTPVTAGTGRYVYWSACSLSSARGHVIGRKGGKQLYLFPCHGNPTIPVMRHRDQRELPPSARRHDEFVDRPSEGQIGARLVWPQAQSHDPRGRRVACRGRVLAVGSHWPRQRPAQHGPRLRGGMVHAGGPVGLVIPIYNSGGSPAVVDGLDLIGGTSYPGPHVLGLAVLTSDTCMGTWRRARRPGVSCSLAVVQHVAQARWSGTRSARLARSAVDFPRPPR